MDLQSAVNRQLHAIHRTRNRIGYLPNIATLLLSLYFQGPQLPIDFRWWTVLALVLAGTVMRILICEVYFRAWEQKERWALVVNFFAFFFLAVGWGLHFSEVHYHYGAESPHVIYTLLVVVAFITGASTSLVADKVSYYTFVITLCICLIVSYISDPKLNNSYIVLNIIIYLYFSITNHRISLKQLCDLLSSQITSQAEKERLGNIINTVPGFVALIDKNGTWFMANHAILSIYPKMVGKKLGTVEKTFTWEKRIVEFMNSEKKTDVFEEYANYKGQDMHALLNVSRTVDGGAIIVSIITTEFVAVQKRLREQEAKALYTSKLASLGEMAAGIAHEVNNPLAIIQGAANILRRMVDENPIDVENAKILTTKMITTSDRISKTVRSLKALSRNGQNDPKEKISVISVINQCLDLCSERCRQHAIEIKFVPPAFEPNVLAREVEIFQVLVNLINNSIDAIKNRDDRWIEIRIIERSRFAEIFLIDSGAGIPLELQQKIMEPFFTTKDVNQGTGLGLSISKNIIHQHGGELSLVTEADHTTFRIRLPLV